MIAHKLRHMMVNMLLIMMKIINNVSNNVIIIGTNKLNQRKFVLLNYHVMMLQIMDHKLQIKLTRYLDNVFHNVIMNIGTFKVETNYVQLEIHVKEL